jgi:ferredoxin-NADP reductase
MAIPEYQFKLLSCNFIAPNVKHFIGQIETTEPFRFTAGQFITVLFEHEEKILRRSYSIANPPDSQLIEFAASYVEGGPGSSYLFSRKPGDMMTVTGPFGRLILKSEVDYQRLFLIATSTGITPYRSMLQTLMNLRQHHPNCTIEIIQGVQKKEHILFAQDLYIRHNYFVKIDAVIAPKITFDPSTSKTSYLNSGITWFIALTSFSTSAHTRNIRNQYDEWG